MKDIKSIKLLLNNKLSITAFLLANKSFTNKTPSIVLNNEKCIEMSLKNNFASINYIKDFNDNVKNLAINAAVKSKYILNSKSQLFLKSNYKIALQSLSEDIESANYVNWETYNEEETKNLINIIETSKYFFSSNSPMFLRNNIKVALTSIKNNIDSGFYLTRKTSQNFDIFKYLVTHNYYKSILNIEDLSIIYYIDEEIMNSALKLLNISDNEEYIKRLNKLFVDLLKSYPKVNTFDKMYDLIALEKWEEYKKKNGNIYNNIFGIITSVLRSKKTFNSCVEELKFLPQMKSILKEEYEILISAMKDYYQIVQSNNIDSLEESRNIISNISAKYISKSKDIYMKKVIKLKYDELKCLFKLNMNSEKFNKKVLLEEKKKIFCERLYDNNNFELLTYIDNLIRKYDKTISRSIIEELIKQYLQYNKLNIKEIINEPIMYQDYLKYIKVKKLINRLNNGYIKYDGIEVINYKDMINFNNNKYTYNGKMFTKEELDELMKYQILSDIFKKIKKDIILKISEEKYDIILSKEKINLLKNTLPFNDDYYKFDINTFRGVSFKDFITIAMHDEFSYRIDKFDEEPIMFNDYYKIIYDLIVNKKALWLNLIEYNSSFSLSNRIVDIINIVNNMDSIVKLANTFNYDLLDYQKLVLLNKIAYFGSIIDVALLGSDIIVNLIDDLEYIDECFCDILVKSKELLCNMAKRNKSTVPFVEGNYLTYNYSIYDSLDSSILLSGINTDACFKVCGVDNDFLHYCALDKNGFVLKITNENNDFIGRASGFRNGNCIFFNQLRTIYDEGGDLYHGNYESERECIINTFISACKDIIDKSQNNKNEIDKIEHVFVTKSYCLNNKKSNVDNFVQSIIGDWPIETEDWDQFEKNTPNLEHAFIERYFPLDYGNYPVICVASVKDKNNIKNEDLIFGNVSALYERKRNKIIVSSIINDKIKNKVNKIKAMKAFIEKKEYVYENIPNDSQVFIGDNWYIILSNNDINSCLLDFDEKAIIELETTKKEIMNCQKNRNKELYNERKLLNKSI